MTFLDRLSSLKEGERIFISCPEIPRLHRKKGVFLHFSPIRELITIKWEGDSSPVEINSFNELVKYFYLQEEYSNEPLEELRDRIFKGGT